MGLTQDQVDHFLQHGWLKIPQCFTEASASHKLSTLWTRLGMSSDDKSTWNKERTNMPSLSTFAARDFAPQAWDAICSVLGGEERIAPQSHDWNDGWIVNLGTKDGEGQHIPGDKLDGWHVDGDFFVHYLDSPEQGLLVIPLFTNIQPGGKGTMICPSAIKYIAEYLYGHPEGVSPRMTPRAQNPTFEPEQGLKWFNDLAASFPDDAFVEASGDVGDVYLLHPLMLHSASNNARRDIRVITNPPVSLHEPFLFDRQDAAEYSLVERKTIQELGGKSCKHWKITQNRDKVVPERLREQARMRSEELSRLEQLKA